MSNRTMSRPAASFTHPATQRALVVNEKDEVVIWNESPCPKLPADQVLLRTEAVAINPSDTKMRGPFVTPFATLGADYAGTVVAVGSDVVDVAVGDRICGAQNEMCALTPAWGAFAEFNVTRGRMWMKVPESWSMEAAASLPVGISTAGLAMRLLGLPLPNKPASKPAIVLVYGGSTATATIAMQLMRLYVEGISYFGHLPNWDRALDNTNIHHCFQPTVLGSSLSPLAPPSISIL